ncbi:MAG TPA: elongation factor P [Candidatus Humimicrobiaceae bacterium]|nr:elongation factor P [Candidatus Humimicrobiaceae bacterium]
MLSYFDLRKGVNFILENQVWEVLEFQQIYKAQDVVVARTKIRNLINGKVLEKTFHQGDNFEEAELEKIEVKFIYSHREIFYFSEAKNPSKRFQLSEEQVGEGGKFLKSGQTLIGIKFQEKIINIILPIKVQLKVVEAPPGVKGERAQAGTKPVTLETGAIINVPLFVKTDDIIEVNTETGQYVRRVE